MKIGDVSRPRRFANPARLRWYAFHRSVRFALRMMKAEEEPSQSEVQAPDPIGLPADPIQGQQPASDIVIKTEEVEFEKEFWGWHEGSNGLL